MKIASFQGITSRSNFRIFLDEKRWQRAVEKQDLKRSGRAHHRSDFQCRLIILLGLLFAVIDGRSRVSRWPVVLLGLQGSPLYQAFRDGLGKGIGDSSMTFASLISGCSLIQLEAAQLLIYRPRLISGRPRKWMLHALICWIDRRLTDSQMVFFLKEDYYGRNSLLTTLSRDSQIKVVGIQHGLMRFRHLLEDDIYPGIRTKQELAYNSNYAQLFRQLKPQGSQVYDFGPPFETRLEVRVDRQQSRPRTAIFISSGDLLEPATLPALYAMKRVFDELNIQFLVRPHPSEIEIAIAGLGRDERPKAELLRMHPEEILFLGFFSTLLYELAWHRFQTIWLTTDLDRDQNIQELGALPGAQIIRLANFNQDFLISKLLAKPTFPTRIHQTLAGRIKHFVEHELNSTNH